MKISLYLLAAVMFLFTVSDAAAQLKNGESIAKIVAVVGDEAILDSDINGQIMMLAQQNRNIIPNDPQLRRQVLDAMINEKLLVTKAIEDSIEASDDEVNQRWNYLLQMYIQKFGSEKRIESIFGMSIARLKYEYTDEIRKQILSEKIRQQKFGMVSVTPHEVEEYYNSQKDSIPELPDRIELYHIVKYVVSNVKLKEEILEHVKKIRDSLINGGNFADFAKRYSGDPGSASAGGDLGWFEKGKLFPEFEKAAFALHMDEISLPVETPFGYHLIQMIDKKKDAVHTRHILFKVGQSGEDIQKTKDFLLDIKKKVESGEDFEKLASEYSEDNDTKGFGGLIGRISMDEIPQSFRKTVEEMKNGEVSEPLAYNSDPAKPAYHIVFKKRTIPKHIASLTEDFKDIERQAKAYKQNKLYLDWIEELRKTMYWEIKEN